MEKIDNVSWAICKIFEAFDDSKEWAKICSLEKATELFNCSAWQIINCNLFNESERRGLETLKDSLERRIV